MTGALTGGIACGKSTAAAFFVNEGFGVVDSDTVVHELLASDEEAISQITARFGDEVRLSDGGINRRRLGGIVFRDSAALGWLESLLHPRVRQIWRKRVSSDPSRPWIVQIPLLFEKKLESSFNFTVCVGTDSDRQLQRLEARGLAKEDAAGRVSRQLPLATKIEFADYYLHNNGSLDFLHAQVKHLATLLLERFRADTTPDTPSGSFNAT